jgi:hypothetical protein
VDLDSAERREFLGGFLEAHLGVAFAWAGAGKLGLGSGRSLTAALMGEGAGLAPKT